MKTLVVYTACNDPKYDLRIKKFVRDGLYKSDDVTFVMIFNGGCTELVRELIPDYVIYFERENVGYDFGAWSRVILHKDIVDYDNYDAYVFINASVYGPCLPRYIDRRQWISFFTDRLNDKTKIVGCTSNYEFGLHMQSYCWCVDKVFLKALISVNYFCDTNIEPLKSFYIYTYEVSNIQIALAMGYDFFSFEYFNNLSESTYHQSICFNDVYKSQFNCNINPYEFMFVKPDFNQENPNYQYILRIDNIK
jgi:lipopolysaccharide biosynthesis protein